ncbi:MAG: 1,6-anhydro-N-acetylmuramyl-L-alanine amidase AmpD, partial [Shewanella fodinae]|nr:1,6-anhydro-N-acetylmuramyl-L-alanine amidase AmpD [Shewanella fodinae]
MVSTRQKSPSPHYNARPQREVSLLVIHNISLPAGCFGLPYIEQLFLGKLDCDADASFADLQGLAVSAHFLIRRDGELVQFVSCDDRAWHAGVSSFEGRTGCNDFAV